MTHINANTQNGSPTSSSSTVFHYIKASYTVSINYQTHTHTDLFTILTCWRISKDILSDIRWTVQMWMDRLLWQRPAPGAICNVCLCSFNTEPLLWGQASPALQSTGQQPKVRGHIPLHICTDNLRWAILTSRYKMHGLPKYLRSSEEYMLFSLMHQRCVWCFNLPSNISVLTLSRSPRVHCTSCWVRCGCGSAHWPLRISSPSCMLQSAHQHCEDTAAARWEDSSLWPLH